MLSQKKRDCLNGNSEGRLLVVYHDFLTVLDTMKGIPDDEVASDLLSRLQARVAVYNRLEKAKGDPVDTIPKRLEPYMVAGLAVRRYHFRKISMAGARKRSRLLPAVYVDHGSDEGLYSIDQADIREVFRRFCVTLRERDMPDMLACIMDDDEHVPAAALCRDPWLVAVGNGIFDDRRKTLLPFTPDLVFLSKIGVDYNPAAGNMMFKNPDGSVWNFDSWMASLNTDPENIRLLYDVIGMVIRPNQPWHKMVLLYSEQGNNGKGTFCRLIRNLLGEDNCEDLQMADFESPFMLSNIMNVQAIIGDENSVGRYMDDIAALKACVTGDPIVVNRKFQDPVKMTFTGLIIQCVNGLPKVRDQSDSWMRRLVFVLMDKCFTGRENPYIKNVYLGHKAVLEYVLKTALERNLTPETLEIPAASERIKDDYKQYNDPVYDFWTEFRDDFVWDLLPYSFLYDLYKKWFAKNHPSGKIISRRQFTLSIRACACVSGEWEWDTKPARHAGKMDRPEKLIVDWNLEDWMNGTYKGNDWKKLVDFEKSDIYRGLLRVTE